MWFSGFMFVVSPEVTPSKSIIGKSNTNYRVTNNSSFSVVVVDFFSCASIMLKKQTILVHFFERPIYRKSQGVFLIDFFKFPVDSLFKICIIFDMISLFRFLIVVPLHGWVSAPSFSVLLLSQSENFQSGKLPTWHLNPATPASRTPGKSACNQP